jgi:hypothetical protein
MNGVHSLLYSKEPEADRVFFQEMHADHPLLGAVLYLMCDDLRSSMQSLKNRKVPCPELLEAEWGNHDDREASERRLNRSLPAQTSDRDRAPALRSATLVLDWNPVVGYSLLLPACYNPLPHNGLLG